MQSLPTELLQKIGYEVERLADRKCLRHTCSRLGFALKPLLLAEVTLNIHTENLEPGLSLLHALVEQSNSEYSEYIRQIRIVSLSPDFYPSPRVAYRRLPPTTGMAGWDSNDPLCAWITDERSTQNKKIRKAQSDIRRLLEPALKSLYNLRVVQWYWRITDPEWISDTIAKSLSILQHIEEFIYQYTVPHYLWPRFPTLPPIILPELRNLKVVSVSILTRQISRHRAGNGVIQSLIDHSPSEGDDLERGMSIRFDSGSWKIPDALEAFLPSAISHLGLYSWILDEVFYTNLTNLTSLELCDAIPVEFGTTRIWSILSSNQIRLQRLIVDYISTGMLDYLESYSGLEHLSLKCTTGHVQTNRDADRFYNQTLVLHEDTLLSLTIQPKFEGKWCFSEGNVGSFRRCRKLQSLSVRVNSEEISVDPISETEGVLFPKHDRLYANPIVWCFPTHHSTFMP
ncbi:hypothetical protein K435DRAFT_443886 [Dendrothele bispora CBS 962.96]|uniref:F-box domain-containing protein n=1 Tax=Dendrothele bispora (strain CBS 962.96) TaxID=1314807 RepID=A0A4S8MEP8_DENBC|nr:hypothetical protein K435DRAFT_443886 [Dendrothele bispora CBS 962.96]